MTNIILFYFYENQFLSYISWACSMWYFANLANLFEKYPWFLEQYFNPENISISISIYRISNICRIIFCGIILLINMITFDSLCFRNNDFQYKIHFLLRKVNFLWNEMSLFEYTQFLRPNLRVLYSSSSTVSFHHIAEFYSGGKI